MAQSKSDKETRSDPIKEAMKTFEYGIEVLKINCPYSQLYSDTFNPEEYGNRVRAGREERKLTQSECGRIIGISGEVLSKIERGDIKKLNPDYLYLLCCLFGVTPDYLLGLAEKQNGVIRYRPDGSQYEKAIVIDLDGHVVKDIYNLLLLDRVSAREKYARYPELYTKLSDILRSDNSDATELLLDVVKIIHKHYKIEPCVGEEWGW